MHFVGYMLGAELLGPKSICSFNFVDSLIDTSSFSQFAEPISPPTGSILASTQCFPAFVFIGTVLVTKQVEFCVFIGLSNILFEQVPIHIIHLFSLLII